MPLLPLHVQTCKFAACLQVLIRQISTSVNPVDYKVRSGRAEKLPKVKQPYKCVPALVLSSLPHRKERKIMEVKNSGV